MFFKNDSYELRIGLIKPSFIDDAGAKQLTAQGCIVSMRRDGKRRQGNVMQTGIVQQQAHVPKTQIACSVALHPRLFLMEG